MIKQPVNTSFPALPKVPTAYTPERQFLGMPVGAVIAFAGEIREKQNDKSAHKTNLPMFNWLVCDGSQVKVANYPELFSALGYRYGGEGGKFNLPNFQGTFLRGVDREGNHQGSCENRTAPKGGNGGKFEVGSNQGFAMQKHTHNYDKPTRGPVMTGILGSAVIDTSMINTTTSKPSTDVGDVSRNETRPVNSFVYWLIKTRLG